MRSSIQDYCRVLSSEAISFRMIAAMVVGCYFASSTSTSVLAVNTRVRHVTWPNICLSTSHR